jgi:hypothetical protein
MKSSSGFAGVQERVHAVVTELRLLRSVEYSAVTVLYALSKKERHASQIVLSILSFLIHPYLQVPATRAKKRA